MPGKKSNVWGSCLEVIIACPNATNKSRRGCSRAGVLGDGLFDPEPWYPVKRHAGKGASGGKLEKSFPPRAGACAIQLTLHALMADSATEAKPGKLAMAKRSTQPPSKRPANLSAQEIEAAIPKLQRRLRELEQAQIDRWDDEVRNGLDSVQQRVEETLVDVFGPDSLENRRYEVPHFSHMVPMSMMDETSDHKWIEGYRSAISEASQKVRTAIEMLQEKLEDLGQAPISRVERAINRTSDSNRVFVVHGHDEEAKQSVARFVERIGLEPIILHEQPDKGRTIIEKFEQNAEPVGFAIIIATPDDVGAATNDLDNLQGRARQNVILELGYFVGRLGRDKVCVLTKGGIEMPSDYIGVIYKELDPNGAWKTELARELRAAGLEVDFEKVVMG